MLCDGKSHKGTSFKPLRWRVPDGKNTQTMYSICDCRYTTRPPFCDGIHYDLPLRYLKKIRECSKQPHDPAVTKLCEECGWAGPRESWPELPPTDSDEDSSDLSDEDAEKLEHESEDAKVKRLAGNRPKVEVELQGSVNGGPTGMDLDLNGPKIGCNGSCQTEPALDGSADPAVSEVMDKIQRVQL
ncbi:hypothetical protein BGZ54_008128 [Gamsiella multidivaricata]|nr:hypothetical protein BGZ54_008128 [Gamsiella multidivaricata]